jgi:hypothetical protein
MAVLVMLGLLLIISEFYGSFRFLAYILDKNDGSTIAEIWRNIKNYFLSLNSFGKLWILFCFVLFLPAEVVWASIFLLAFFVEKFKDLKLFFINNFNIYKKNIK